MQENQNELKTVSHLIYIYNEIPEDDLDLKQVLAYLTDRCPFAKITVRDNFSSHFLSDELIAGLTDCINTELSVERGFDKTDEERLAYERQTYLTPETISPNVIYDGWRFLELLQAQIPEAEATHDTLHLILTPRLLVTEDERKRRYHARTILIGQPSVISSTGLLEAPARPVEYYVLQRGYQMLGQNIPDAEVKERFGGQFLEYHDLRLTEVIQGYLLQAIAYRFFGEGFCHDPHCRLYNAHRQQEMLTAQLELPELCSKHRRLFELV